MLAISYIGILICLINVKVRNKAENIINKIVSTLIFLLAYNGIIGIIFAITGVKITQLNISILNFLVIISIIFLLNKKGKAEFEKIPKKELVMCILGVLLGVLYLQLYETNFNITFETTDPATHMNFVNEFLKNKELLLTLNTSIPYNHMSDYPFLHYLNNGIVHYITNEVDVYKTYIGFNYILFILFTLKSYYFLMEYIRAKKTSEYIWCALFTCLLILGFPLNALIFGFSSQLICFPIILLTLSIICFRNSIYSSKLYYLIMNVLLLGVFYSYYYYIPELFLAIGMYILIKNKKIKLVIEEGLKTFFIPIIGGFIFLFYFTISGVTGESTSLDMEGYIWRDLLNSFSIFIPILIYYCINRFKQRRIDIIDLFCIFNIIFNIFILVLGMNGKASSYYYYKNYYVLCIPIIILIAKQLIESFRKNKELMYTIIITVVGVVVLLGGGDQYIATKNNLFNPTPLTYNNVYWFNKFKLDNPPVVFDKDDLELIEHIKQNKDAYSYDNKMAVVGNTLQLLWFREITGIWPKFDTEENLAMLYDTNLISMDDFLNDINYEYIAIFTKGNEEWIKTNINMDDFGIIKKVGSAILIKK